MTSNSRRRLLGGLIATIVAPLAGLLGGRARAQMEPGDPGAMERAAGRLQPMPLLAGSYQYRCIVEEPIRGSVPGHAADIPAHTTNWRDHDEAILLFRRLDGLAEEFGGRVRIERRWIMHGPIERFEDIVLPGVDSGRPREVLGTPPGRTRDGKRLADVTREEAEHYRRLDACPNDVIRHPWHGWKEPKSPRPDEGADDYLRVVIPAGD